MHKWRWGIFQMLIVFAVVGTNIRYQWTPNPMVAGLIGYGAAYCVTWLLARWIYRDRGQLSRLPPVRPARARIRLSDQSGGDGAGVTPGRLTLSEFLEKYSGPRVGQDRGERI